MMNHLLKTMFLVLALTGSFAQVQAAKTSTMTATATALELVRMQLSSSLDNHSIHCLLVAEVTIRREGPAQHQQTSRFKAG